MDARLVGVLGATGLAEASPFLESRLAAHSARERLAAWTVLSSFIERRGDDADRLFSRYWPAVLARRLEGMSAEDLELWRNGIQEATIKRHIEEAIRFLVLLTRAGDFMCEAGASQKAMSASKIDDMPRESFYTTGRALQHPI